MSVMRLWVRQSMLACTVLAFERAHFVFLLTLDLMGDGEVIHAMAAQVEGVEVTGGRLQRISNSS